MDRIVPSLMKLAALGALALTTVATTGCFGEAYGGDPAYYPSDTQVATDDPVYYDGQATYFSGGRWYYRNGGRWSYYRSEPSYLRQYRGAHPSVGRGGAMGRGGVRGGFGGAHPGGHGGRH